MKKLLLILAFLVLGCASAGADDVKDIGLDWYKKRYVSWFGYCEGIGSSECNGKINCQCSMKDFNPQDFTAEEIKSLIVGVFYKTEYIHIESRVQDILAGFYKYLFINPEGQKYAALKEYAYDKDVLEKIIPRGGEIISYIPQGLPYYREVVMKVLDKHSHLYKKLPRNVRGDKEIALIAVSHSGFFDLSDRLKEDKDILIKFLEVARYNIGDRMKYVPIHLKNDTEILAAIDRGISRDKEWKIKQKEAVQKKQTEKTGD